MSLKDISAIKHEHRPKSVADALGGKVGYLQAMLQAIKTVSRSNAPAVLETLFGLTHEQARDIVELLRPDSKKEEWKTVNEQIRERTGKTAQENAAESRARAQLPSKALAKVIKKAASLCDRLDENDREKAAQVIRECMEATTPFYNMETKQVEERIDAKMRLAAVTLMLAYDEGLPVQRVISGRVEMETGEETLARLKASPEAMRAMKALSGAGLKMEIGGEIIDVEAEILKPDSD